MKPHEILKKIIDENGSCTWIGNASDICRSCPFGGDISCVNVVTSLIGEVTNADYLEAAKKMLAKIEAERIILGGDFEK